MTSGPLMDYSLVRALQERVGNALADERQQRSLRNEPELSPAYARQLSQSLTRTTVSQYVREQLARGVSPPDDDHFHQRLITAIDAAIWGAGELQQLLDDPGVENIDINGCDQVFVTYADERGTVAASPVAATDEDLIDIVRTLGAYGMNARPFTPSSPELDLRLPDGSRLSAIMSASQRPLVSIRRDRYPQIFLSAIPAGAHAHTGAVGAPASLVQLGALDERLAAFLTAAVLARANIIVAGATDAGKTTLLRGLINAIPGQERLITVERALELGIDRHPHLHPNVAAMEEVLPGADGGGGVTIGQLVRRTRRQNPSRVIVGEVLGPEVVEMLSAMSQGNDGSLSTIHARSASDVFARLAVYAAQHESLPVEVTHGLIGGAIDYVVFIAKNPRLGGRRTVTEVVEVTGSGGGHVTRSRIFGPSVADGRAERDSEVPIMRADLLAQAGYEDAAWAPPWHQFDEPGYRNGRW
jgi:Flp pilus assembly CpaF family ATPase